MTLQSSIKRIGALGISVLFLFPAFSAVAFAQVNCTKDYCPLTTVPGAYDACKSDANGNVVCEKGVVKNPVEVIKNFYGIAIGIGAILAVIMIIWAGIEYATTESITGHSGAKERWQGAVFGLILLLSSYIILRTINPDLVNINLDLGKPLVGQEVSSNALEKIIDSVDRNAKAVLQAEQKVNDAQKSINDLKTEHDKLAQQLKGMNIASPEGKALNDQIVQLEKNIAAKEQEKKDAEVSLSNQRFTQRTSNAIFTATNALSRGDLNEITKSIQTSKTLLQKDINDLRSAGATKEEIDSAIKRMNGVSSILNKLTEAATVTQTKPSNVGNNYYYSADTINKRNVVNTNLDNTMNSLILTDPKNAEVYKDSVDRIKQVIDKNIASALHCSNGLITVTTSKISCKN